MTNTTNWIQTTKNTTVYEDYADIVRMSNLTVALNSLAVRLDVSVKLVKTATNWSLE